MPHQGNTHQPIQQTPRQRLEELRSRQAQSGPIGGPVLEAPAPQVPTGQPSPSLVLPREREEAGERVQFARLEELREKKRRAEVRGELSQSISRFTDPAALPTAIFGVSAQLSGLAGDEPRPLLGRASQLAAQGATLGFADEIEAGIVGATQPLRNLTSFGSGRTMGEAAQQQRDVTRQQLKESREAAPVTSFGLEAAGGGVIGGAPAARFLGQATSRGSLAARSSGLGATTGGVVGFGESEGDFGERLPSAGVGAVTGGLLGGASPLVIEGITRAGSVISRSAGRAFNNIRTGRNVTKDQRRAMNKIMQRVEQDGFTAEQFQARLDRAKELGIESDFIFEMAGPQLLDLAKGGAATGSEAAIKGLAKVRIRQSNVESRVAEDLRAAIGSDGSDFLSRSQSIEKAKIAAAPLYAQFRSLPPIPRSSNVTGRAGGEAGRAAPSEQTLKLESFFDNPLFTRAAKQSASSALSRDGVVIDIEKNLTPDVLDRIKRTIDELINTAQSRTDATAVGDLTALKSRYVSFLDDQYPGIYSSARKAFAGPAAQEEALELGESLIRSAKARRAPEAVVETISNMSADELAAFRVGVARSVVNQMRTAPSPIVRTGAEPVDLGTDPANPIRRFFNTDQQRDVIRAAFGNDTAFNSFAKRMASEAQRAENFRAVNVRQGSPTQGRQRAAERLGEVTEAATDIGLAGSGNPIAMLRSVTNLLRRGDSPSSPAVQEEIQRILFSTPAEQRPIIERALQGVLAQEQGGPNALAAGRQIVGPLLAPAAIASERVRN